MKKIIFIILTLLSFVTTLNAGSMKSISAGYNSNGDQVYLKLDYALSAVLASRGVSRKFIAEKWLQICAPSNIYRGKVTHSKVIDNGASRKLFIKNKWKSFGSSKSELLLIFGDGEYSVRCLKDGR